jgi:hypothetical protein
MISERLQRSRLAFVHVYSRTLSCLFHFYLIYGLLLLLLLLTHLSVLSGSSLLFLLLIHRVLSLPRSAFLLL